MADIKISELTQVSALNNGDLVEVSQVNALAPSGYTSLKASMTDLGEKVNTDIEYTTDLADFTDKTTLGAIKETAKDKNVADEYDATQTYDKGDVVIYKNTLYICTTNNTTGAWDATKWTATTVQSLIGDLSQLTTTDKSSLVGAVNEVNKLETVSISTSGAIANLYQSNASKQNKLVVVNLNLSLTSSTALYALLCTMSKKPVSDIQFFLHSSSNNLMYECKIFATDGKIQWWNNNAISSGAIIGGQLVYFTND